MIEMAAVTKKRELRKSVRQSGWITFEGGFAARQCTVHDISSSGAKIIVDDPNVLPARLRLASPAMPERGGIVKSSGVAESP